MKSKTTNKFSPEVRARSVRMLLDHESEHPCQIALKRSPFIALKVSPLRLAPTCRYRPG